MENCRIRDSRLSQPRHSIDGKCESRFLQRQIVSFATSMMASAPMYSHRLKTSARFDDPASAARR
jgi:hypothetical protein